MGRPTQPYLYARPISNLHAPNGPWHGESPRTYGVHGTVDNFDPKAITRASWTLPAPSKIEQDGPLLDFNRHPDSWIIPTPKNQNSAKGSAKYTKKHLLGVRRLQLVLRCCNLLVALAELVMVIMTTHVSGTAGWAIRLAPAVDLVNSSYAIYHLFKAATSFTPGTSTSYHFFALIIDIALLPFYVYTTLLGRWEYQQSGNSPDRWGSLIDTATATNVVLLSVWTLAIIASSLHGLSGCASAWLCWKFRQICNLPPDMNPLEDNLTRRLRNKHMHKNSELTGSTFDDSDELNEKDNPHVDHVSKKSDNTISFLRTRQQCNMNGRYLPNTQTTTDASRTSLPIPMPPQYMGHLEPQNSLKKPNSPSQQSCEAFETQNISLRSASAHPGADTTSNTYDREELDNDDAPDLPRKSSKRMSAAFQSSDNWYAMEVVEEQENIDPMSSLVNVEFEDGIVDDDDEEEDDDDDTYDTDKVRVPALSSRITGKQSYGPLRQSSYTVDARPVATPHTRTEALPQIEHNTRQPIHKPLNQVIARDIPLNPLTMNPPTPPPTAQRHRMAIPIQKTNAADRKQHNAHTPSPQLSRVQPALLETSANKGSPQSKSRPTNAPASDRDRASTPVHKGKHYGDLQSALLGIRNSPSPSPRSNLGMGQPALPATAQPTTVSQRIERLNKRSWREPGVGMGEWLKKYSAMPSSVLGAYTRSDAPTTASKERESPRTEIHRDQDSGIDRKGRVISRTGADASPLSGSGHNTHPDSSGVGDDSASWIEGDDGEREVLAGYAGMNRRLVSGKIVEEGFAGGFLEKMAGSARRRVSGRTQ